MQFHIPQFIDIEDKIFGPLTLKQFIYVLGGAGSVFVIYSFLPLYLATIPMLAVGGLAFMLAFRTINNQSFAKIMEAAFKYFFSDKLFLWRKDASASRPSQRNIARFSSTPIGETPVVTGGKLEDISWNLDVNTGQIPGKELSHTLKV
jgi:hypothetical protein